MSRGIFSTVLWACLIACIGVGLFFIKHEVKDQEHRLAALAGEIHRNQETIHVLRAEWSYLNDPARLRALSEKHLGMRPVTPNQVATLDQVLKDGLPPATMLAAVVPVRPPQVPAAAKSHPQVQPQPQPVKLVEGPPRPRAAESAKPPPRPTPPKPGTVTLANSPPPAPAASPVPASPTSATVPVRGNGRTIIIQSPALAEREGGVP
jgi:cell division protein FtsL